MFSCGFADFKTSFLEVAYYHVLESGVKKLVAVDLTQL